MIFARSLGEALRQSLEDDPRVVLLGEDILDPYGGAFKVVRGHYRIPCEHVGGIDISQPWVCGISILEQEDFPTGESDAR